ncbi:MAG: hypothetical protein DRP85_07555 [Candidatus Makaraimicrobium thalassicum]|nr:MAG: hypothetical protein DRP85_07555 [Candidatus Omnitrophota bacterium]
MLINTCGAIIDVIYNIFSEGVIMRRYGRVFKCFFAVFLGLALFTCHVFAEGIADDKLFKKGVYLFRQENYEEALDTFGQVTKKYPGSSLAEYYLGLTYKRGEDYVAAKEHLEASLMMKPKIKGALMELIDLLYRIGEYDEAKKWISVAENEGIRPAQAKFLKGLTLQKSGEYEGSIEAFEQAKDLDDRLTQSADYQIGVCCLKMKRFRDARDVFEDVFALDPYSDIAGYADRYIKALERRLEKERPFHLMAKCAFEYDSNVLLQPTDSMLVTGITENDDTRQVFDLKPGYIFRNDDDSLSLKTGYGLHVSKQNDFGGYDVIGNSLSAQGNVSVGKILVTFPVNYSHTIVGDKNYLSSFNAGNVNNFMIGKSQMGQLGALYKYDDYLRPALPEEDRTGSELTGIAGWFWFFAGREGFVNLRYSFTRDWAEGNNWEYWGNKISAGVLYPLWDKFKLNLNGEVFFQDFENTHTVYGEKREDQVYAASSSLSYEIFKNIELQARYIYINDRSNLGIYEYDRHIVSTGVQYKF